MITPASDVAVSVIVGGVAGLGVVALFDYLLKELGRREDARRDALLGGEPPAATSVARNYVSDRPWGPEAVERWRLLVEAWGELTDDPHPFGPCPPLTPSAAVTVSV